MATFFKQFSNTVKFGANLQGLNNTDEPVGIKDRLKCKYVRDSFTLQGYNGGPDAGVQARFNAGLKVILNINWSGGGSGGGGKLFPTNLTNYRNTLDNYMSFNADFIEVAVIENEPYNGTFFDYTQTTVQDYLAELAVAIDVCHSWGVKVADGCTHYTYYNDLMNPPVTGDAAQRADEALSNNLGTGYNVLNLDYVNFHFTVPGNMSTNSALSNGIIRRYTKYLNQRTGHPVMTNEWHQTDLGTILNQDDLCRSIVSQMRDAHIHYALVFSGDANSNALPFVDQSVVITHLGTAFRDAILSGV